MNTFACKQCGRQYTIEEHCAVKEGQCRCGAMLVAPPDSPVRVVELVEESPTVLADYANPISEVMPAVIKDRLYICEMQESPDDFVTKHQTYCENCKRTFLGYDGCPLCRSQFFKGLMAGCTYCRTSYKANRKKCPNCVVGANIDNAKTATTPSKKLA